MKAADAIVFTILICGCISGVNQAPDKEAHYVSGRPQLAGCNNRTTVADREYCYMDVATSIPSAGLCEDIGSVSLRNLCNLKIAKKTVDPGLCGNIKNDDRLFTDCITSTTR